MGSTNHTERDLLPEWSEVESDDERWIAEMQAIRRREFAELANL